MGYKAINIDEDDIIPFPEWLEMVRIFALIDDDGYGHPVLDNSNCYDTDIVINPSDFLREPYFIKPRAVAWFNR